MLRRRHGLARIVDNPASIPHQEGVKLPRFRGVGKRSWTGRLLKGERCLIAEGRMEALAIIEDFEVLKDATLGLVWGCQGAPVEPLRLEGAEEALHHGVVVAIATAAHTDHQAVLG